MPLQFRSDTGALLMVESGSLADACCCAIALDLTPIMRSLSEALHYIADENGLNQEFGSGQGEAWPNQRTAPFASPPADGEDIPPDFYESDYDANIQYMFDDLQTIIDNYNYVKNFFLKTPNPFLTPPATLDDFTVVDDYNPGTIDSSNFMGIRANVISLVNDILRVQVSTEEILGCQKYAFSQLVGWDNSYWNNVQNCALTMLSGAICGKARYSTRFDPSDPCILSLEAPVIFTKITYREMTFMDMPTCAEVDADLNLFNGHVESDLSNFTTANQSGVFLKLGKSSILFFGNPVFSDQGPVPLEGVFQNWVSPTLGAAYASPDLAGDSTPLAFTFTGPDPGCAGADPLAVGSGWELEDSAVVLIRSQTHIAS